MTKLLDTAVAALRKLPPVAQDDIAGMVLRLMGDDASVVTLTTEERAAITASKAEAVRGEFATDQELHALWAKYAR